MKAKWKLLSKKHAVDAGTRLRSVSKGTCHNPSSQEHILNESPSRAPRVALKRVLACTYTHCNPLHCCLTQLPFPQSVPGLHSNGSHLHSDCFLQQRALTCTLHVYCTRIDKDRVQLPLETPVEQWGVCVQGSDNTKTCLELLSQEVPVSVSNFFTV